MPVVSLTSALVLVSSLAALLVIRDYQKRRGLPYPPGPRPLPLIGNLLDLPKTWSWLLYTELAKKHGDVLSFHVLGKVVVVLNSSKANKDLLDKRGEIYSNRPAFTILEMMKWDWHVAFSNYNESWRLARKLLNRSLRPAAIVEYHHLLQTKTRDFLTRVSANPEAIKDHFNHLTGSLILSMTYGYEFTDPNDRKVYAAKKVAQLSSETTLPGLMLVNDLPFLRHIPEWVPWLSYKPFARFGYNIGQEVLYEPMVFVKESVLNGTAKPSLALENLQETETLDEPERKKAEDVIARALGSMYSAGTDTTACALLSFIVATLLRPEIQKIAHKELDAVTRRERLPTFEDRPRLPFVDAICKEVLRWRPTAPLGLPRATAEDDVYEGYFIPKGAMVIVNIWGILHDPAVYSEPDVFKPERFIDSDGGLIEDPVLQAVYGFGKRNCPGRHLVDTTLFIVIASLLSVFDVKGTAGSDGASDKYPFTGNGINFPCPFTCSITPRDKTAEELIAANAPTQ